MFWSRTRGEHWTWSKSYFKWAQLSTHCKKSVVSFSSSKYFKTYVSSIPAWIFISKGCLERFRDGPSVGYWSVLGGRPGWVGSFSLAWWGCQPLSLELDHFLLGDAVANHFLLGWIIFSCLMQSSTIFSWVGWFYLVCCGH